MHAVILAAGKGTRLRPLTETTPKALVDVKGRPLLAHILDALPQEIHEIILVVGHLQEQVRERIGAVWNGRPVRYIAQETLDGTGTAVHLAKPFVQGSFLVVNGDDLYAAADLSRLIAHPTAILLRREDGPVSPSALVDADGRFVGLEADPPAHEPHLRVCGAYVLDERFFRYPLARVPVRSHEEYSLPHTLVEAGKDLSIRAEYATSWQPVGTPEELAAVNV